MQSITALIFDAQIAKDMAPSDDDILEELATVGLEKNAEEDDDDEHNESIVAVVRVIKAYVERAVAATKRTMELASGTKAKRALPPSLVEPFTPSPESKPVKPKRTRKAKVTEVAKPESETETEAQPEPETPKAKAKAKRVRKPKTDEEASDEDGAGVMVKPKAKRTRKPKADDGEAKEKKPASAYAIFTTFIASGMKAVTEGETPAEAFNNEINVNFSLVTPAVKAILADERADPLNQMIGTDQTVLSVMTTAMAVLTELHEKPSLMRLAAIMWSAVNHEHPQ